MRLAVPWLLAGTLLAWATLGNDLAPDVLLENGHFKRLRTVAEKKAKANPNDAAAQYYLARIKYEQGDLDAALPLAEKAAALDPQNADCRYMIAGIYGRKAQHANIFKKFGLARRYKQEAEAAIAINPLHMGAREGLMEFHLKAPGIIGGDKKKAEQYINEIMRIDPARGNLAEATRAVIEEKLDLLESFYDKAVEANPKNYSALFSLANYYLGKMQQKPDLSEEHLREALHVEPVRIGPYSCLANLYSPAKHDAGEAQKEHNLAEKHLRKALQAEPDRIGAYSCLASLYAFRTRWQNLGAVIAQAEKAVPDNLAPYFFAGTTLTGSGKDNARAERYLLKYLSMEPEITGPSHAVARWQLALLYEKMGREDEAIRELETAVQLDPDFEEAKKDLKRVKQSRRGR